jgi:hypothetical protein
LTAEGFDGSDEGLDQALAAAWLENERLYVRPNPDDHSLPDGYDVNIQGQVLELMQTDLDPLRGARLVLKLLALAEDEGDLGSIGRGPLETLVRNHSDYFAAWADQLAETNPRFRAALGHAYPHGAVAQTVERLGLHKGRTHGYWTIAIELACVDRPPVAALLDARLLAGVTGGAATADRDAWIINVDYWARDLNDATESGNRIVDAMVARLAPYGCTVRRRAAPEPAWRTGERPGIDPPRRGF